MNLFNFIQTQNQILFDGAIGTELAKRGLGLTTPGINNLIAPEVVLAIHREYADSGCHILTTNTLTMNRIYLETHNVDIDVREVNLAGANLARQAVGAQQFVIGDISSTGQLLEPYGNYTESEFYDCFKKQAELLAEGGVDGFIIETMIDLREAGCALRACKENFALPVFVSLSFMTETNSGRTVMGNTVAECAQQLTELGADAIGANCGELDLPQIATIISLFRSATSLPLLAQPNAGKPKLVNQQTVFDMTPADFAAGIKQCITAGARLVGGCCGTTPDHIRAIDKLLK